MSAEKNEYIEKTYQQPQTISQDRQRQLEYDAWLKATLDYNQGMLEAEQRGFQKGFQQGLQRGLQQAEQEIKEIEATEAHTREIQAYIRKAEARIRELEQMLEEQLQQSAENQPPETS